MNAPLSWPVTVFFVLVFGVLLPLGVAVIAAIRVRGYLARARHFRDAASAPFTGRPGPAVLSGRTRWIEPAECPVHVTITQAGSERTAKGNPYVAWTEQGRRAHFAPFEVETGKTPIRVEPDDETLYADALDESEIVGPGVREKRARLSQGEPVWIEGALRPTRNRTGAATAYRGAVATDPESVTRPLVFMRKPFEPLVIHTSPPGQEQRSRILFNVAAIAGAIAVFLAMNLVVNRDFVDSLLHGRVALGVATGRRTEIGARSKTGAVIRLVHFVTFELPPSELERTVEARTDPETYAEVEQDEHTRKTCSRLVRYTPGDPWNAVLGERPLARWWVVVVSPIVMILAAAYFLQERNLRPWYEGRKLNETEPGRLPWSPR
ncbi:MAG: hypothetical protein U0414_27500 [Polyangiaceae bacterium]